MIRYLIYLILDMLMEVLAVLLAPILPLFASQDGWLPKWLWWFQTPDNPLSGDAGWQQKHPNDTYWDRGQWVWRNRAYGFKWSVLAATVVPGAITYQGDPTIKNRENAKAGWLDVQMQPYWQCKRVWRIGQTTYCLMPNFGWLLDPYIANPDLWKTQPKALYMFSPRITRFYPPT